MKKDDSSRSKKNIKKLIVKKLCLLGCAWPQIPIIFDIAYETLGITNYKILKNIFVEAIPDFTINTNIYKFKVYEPEALVSLKGTLLTFGVTGPKAKHAVYTFFKSKYNIDFTDFINIIHPSSYLASSVQLKNGLFIEPKVIISSQAKIGNGVTLKRGANIGHNCEIGDYVEINPGVIVSGETHVRHGCIIGVGSVLNNHISIGENTFIGMGSVVNNDIPAGVIAYGNPCKVIRANTLWQI